LIKAWVDGAEIQVKAHSADLWQTTASPMWSPDTEYRIVPEKKKYIVSLHSNSEGGFVSISSDGEREAQSNEEAASFVKWLTDWVEYEV